MNIVNSLKKLYTSLGGNADTVKDVQTAPDMVDALAGIASSTIELPAVDAEDNGKVLKVANGKWGKGTDNSLPEVTSADEGDVLTVNAEGAWAKSVPTKELPEVTAGDEGNVLTVNSQGNWTKASPAKELPYVTESDNGSVLSVVNGAWAKDLKIKKITRGKQPTSGSDEIVYDVSEIDLTNTVVIGLTITDTNTISYLKEKGSVQIINEMAIAAYGDNKYPRIILKLPSGTTFSDSDIHFYKIDIYYIEFL